MVSVRTVPATDREQFDRILRYAFAPQRGPTDGDDRDGRGGDSDTTGDSTAVDSATTGGDSDDDWPPSLWEPRGVYDDDTLCSTAKLYTPPATIRGRETSVAAIGGVATLPEHRTRGHVRRLLADTVERYRADGVEFAALWAFSTPFYERLGWATAYSYTEVTTPPAELPSHDAAGDLRRLDADDWQRLSRAAARNDEGATFTVRRTETWWRERVFDDEGWQDVPYCYGYERDGDLVGALLYHVDGGETTTLRVQNLLTADEEARRALLSFLGNHGAQVESVLLRGEPDAELLTRLDDPGPASCELRRGPMVRLTELSALEHFAWPGAVDCRLAVTDPLGVADGLVRLRVADGEATVERLNDVSEGTESDDADATVGVGTLSQLAVGTHDVATARRVGDLSVRTDGVAAALDDVFRPGAVRLRQFF